MLMLYLKKYIKNKEVFIQNVEKRNKNIQAQHLFEVLEKYLNLKNKQESALNKKNTCNKKIQQIKDNNSKRNELINKCKELNIEINNISNLIKELDVDIINENIPCLLDDKVTSNDVKIFDNIRINKNSFENISAKRWNKYKGILEYPFSSILEYLLDDIKDLLYKKWFEYNIITNLKQNLYVNIIKWITFETDQLPKRIYLCWNLLEIKILWITKENDNQKEFDFYCNILSEILNNYKIGYKIIINNAQDTQIYSSIEYLYKNNYDEILWIISNLSDYCSYQNNIKYSINKEKKYVNIVQLSINLEVLLKEYVIHNYKQDYRITLESIKSYKLDEKFI